MHSYLITKMLTVLKKNLVKITGKNLFYTLLCIYYILIHLL